MAATGPPVLFVPSLVNRAYVLDLAPGHSMLRWLAGHGVRPLLAGLGLAGRGGAAVHLDRLRRRPAGAGDARRSAAGPVVLAGYCMGGTLAVAAAQRRPDLVRGAGAAGRAVGFPRRRSGAGGEAGRMLPRWSRLMALGEALPVDCLQVLFALLDPFGVGEKYRASPGWTRTGSGRGCSSRWRIG